MKIGEILLDNVPLDLNSMIYQLKNDGYQVLFYTNMTIGLHELVINYSEDVIQFPDDLDGDLIQDKFEVFLNTDPNNDDIDGDSIIDGIEMFKIGSNPFSEDTDFDGMPDGWELENGLNPISDDGTGDLDNDGVLNIDEFLNGLDPQKKDSDGDGIDDFTELYNTTYSSPTSNSDLPSDSTTDISNSAGDDQSYTSPWSSTPTSSTEEATFLLSPIMLIPVLFYLIRRKSKISVRNMSQL